MPETKATFHRAGYDGEYRVAYNGEHVGYISQALDRNAWLWQGRRFKYLFEAKEAARDDLETEAR